MKKAILLVAILVAWGAFSFADFPGSPIGGGGGGSGTTNASDLTSGTVAVARGGTGAGTAAAALTALGGDNASNITKGGLDNIVIGSTTPAAGTFTTVTAVQFVSSSADNTHSGNVKNTSSPTGTNLAAGNYWTLLAETMLLRNQDNTATNILASAYQYRDFAFDNSAMDNMVLIQNLPFTEVWDNVLYTVRGYVDGKVTGAATDNVTTNFYCCAATDNTLAQCTAMFNTAPVPTGAATLSPAINNGTCAAGNEIRISFSGINLTSKKLNIRERHLRR